MIISDSLGQPRRQDGKVLSFHQTWPYFLSRFLNGKGVTIPIFSNYGFDTNQLAKQINYYSLYQPEIIFIQLGIVDCPRRAVSKNALYVLSRLPVINKITKWFTNKYHFQLTRLYKINYTSKKLYEQNLQKMIEAFPDSRIYLLPILPVGSSFQRKSYDIDRQINEYNKILSELSVRNIKTTFLSEIELVFKNNIENLTFSDGFHLNHKGQGLLFKEIVNSLEIYD